MMIGDLVSHVFKTWSLLNGIIVDIKHWRDSGAPDRNFGTNIYVLWPTGEIGTYEDDELMYVNESEPTIKVLS